MQTQFFDLTGGCDTEILRTAGKLLREGGLVAFPTETVYGLGGNALNADSSRRIYEAKGRPSDNPLIVHLAEPGEAERYCVTCELYYRIAKRFMPGPLTVILPKRYENGVPVIPDETTGGLDSAAIRVPVHPIAHKLILASGVPIAAPSANRSGRPSPTSAAHVRADLDGRIDAILDGGDTEYGLESTVVKIDGDGLILLRPGAVTEEDLRAVCSHVRVETDEVSAKDHPLSPGLKYRHYSPNTPFLLLDGTPDAVTGKMKALLRTERCAVLCYDEDLSYLDSVRCLSLGPRNRPDMQAHRLFACLRQADELGVDRIYAPMPAKDGIGFAVYNRMIRAAAHQVISLNDLSQN